MSKTFLFYDLETSGLDKAFDQVMQFAAIRTDASLNELERYEYPVAITKDIIPSARAMITHGQPLLTEGPGESEVIPKIRHLLCQPYTWHGGFNTLSFDDEFLRYSFYRQLLDPYRHQYADHCNRFDVLPMVVMYHALAPDVMHWPMIDNVVSYKLEHLNAENKWVSGQAHDAMVDVSATIAVAKALLQQQDRWHYLLGFFEKGIDQDRVWQAANMHQSNIVIGVGLSLGKKDCCMAPMMVLPQSPRGNQVWLFRMDRPMINGEWDASAIVRKKWGEPPFILPFNERFKERLSTVQLEVLLEMEGVIKQNDARFKEWLKVQYEHQYPHRAHLDIDASLYVNGFYSQKERDQSDVFLSEPEHRDQLLQQVEHTGLRQQMIRWLWRFDPAMARHQEVMAQKPGWYLDNRPVDLHGHYQRSPEDVLNEIKMIKQEGVSDASAAILNTLEQFIMLRYPE